ncbi:ABC transporter ATP-binding protein [Archangium lipolyticum]|uniref:ABC transporter ATP-binding protein n=1 Tax=Archangium lipolyticum TaxID=2970465 RepID=UPI002149A33D|nr:ABC transporter transmembrane domain-containing protein [Archangium lipolyticum]
MSQASSPVLLRRILGLARSEGRALSVGIFFLLLGSGMALLFPQALRFIVDEALGARNQALIDRAALGVIAVFAVQAVADALRYYFFTTAGERIVTRLRHDLFSSLVAQEVAFFDEHKTGEITSRLTADTQVLQNAVSNNIAIALRSGAQAVGGLALLLYTSPILTLLMLAVVPPVVVATVLFGRRIRQTSRKVQAALAEANGVADEVFSGIRTVRAFAAERQEVGRYRHGLGHAVELARERTRLSTAYVVSTSFASIIAASMVLWYGSRLMLRGEFSIGSLTSFLVYSILVATALSGLTDLWADLMRASGSAERVFEMLDRQPSMPSTGGERIRELRGQVEFQAVRFAYPSRPDVPVLQEIDLVLQPGEVVALVGPSGGGKSTLAALLARMYDPQGGRILVDGVELRTLDPEWLRQQIGSVAQEPMLFSGPIADNIRYGRADATDAEVEAAARAANAHVFISRFPEGYRTLVGERGVQLSGGQKQRIAIARAVLKNPRLLVLDEATSALDAESEHLVQEALERLMQGRTTLIIAHRLSTVIGADRVLVLEGGRVVQSGNHATLMGQDGLYRRLVERQFVAA